MTDALSLSNNYNNTWDINFKGKRFDCGSKLGLFKAQLAVAYEDKKIKDDIKNFIRFGRLDLKISVIGAGYVGLVTASCFSEFGYEVLCIDNNQIKIKN